MTQTELCAARMGVFKAAGETISSVTNNSDAGPQAEPHSPSDGEATGPSGEQGAEVGASSPGACPETTVLSDDLKAEVFNAAERRGGLSRSRTRSLAKRGQHTSNGRRNSLPQHRSKDESPLAATVQRRRRERVVQWG